MSKFTTSFTSQLDKVVQDTFITYRGRVIERIDSHSFRVGKANFKSIEDAKLSIDNSYKILLSSIR